MLAFAVLSCVLLLVEPLNSHPPMLSELCREAVQIDPTRCSILELAQTVPCSRGLYVDEEQKPRLREDRNAERDL